MGAMENWGLITFRETALLVDKANAPARTLQHVAYVVSHELAHQWFGNLVTMKWWTDLWLNEGFATWVGHLGVDHVHPEWDTWTQVCSKPLRPPEISSRWDPLKCTENSLCVLFRIHSFAALTDRLLGHGDVQIPE